MNGDKSHAPLINANGLPRLLEIMERLRDPDTGCPWDIEQTFATIAPYTIEEAYEVADAIERANMADLRDELGDLLLQVVYHARIAEEAGDFAFSDVIESISEKMIRRHPHVFGDESRDKSAQQQTADWEKIKAAERGGDTARVLDGVAVGLPALTRAVKLQNRAARVGFDWPNVAHVMDKLIEESRELTEAYETLSPEKVEEEFGDLAFVLANIARHLKIDPEAALRRANDKFTRRFNAVEDEFSSQDQAMSDKSLAELDEVWGLIKSREST